MFPLEIACRGRKCSMLFRQIYEEAPALQVVGSFFRIWSAPYRANFRLACATGDFRRLPALVFHIGLNDLRDYARRQVSVLTFFEQRCHDNLRISPRGHADKPAVVLEF